MAVLLILQLVIAMLRWNNIRSFRIEPCSHRVTRAFCTTGSSSNLNFKVPILVATSGMKLSSDIKKQVEEKLGHVLEKVGRDASSAHISLQTNNFRDNEHHCLAGKKGSQTAEVTVYLKRHKVLHAKARSDNMFASIDTAAHKLMRLFVKQNQKYVDAQRKRTSSDEGEMERIASYEDLNEQEIIQEFETFFFTPLNASSAIDDRKE